MDSDNLGEHPLEVSLAVQQDQHVQLGPLQLRLRHALQTTGMSCRLRLRMGWVELKWNVSGKLAVFFHSRYIREK